MLIRRYSIVLATLLALLTWTGHAKAMSMNIRVIAINDYLTAFYDGRPAQPAQTTGPENWADFGALYVGVATYVIHRGDQALVYDSFPYLQEAQFVRDYLSKTGIKHFTLVNSHWHLDHVGGNAAYADCDRIGTNRTIALLSAEKRGIETGELSGPPAINPLVIPNIGIDSDATFYVGDIKVELRPIEIHSEDGLVIYLPKDRILLAGDTLEDTVTFIAEPDHIITHYRNLGKMREWDIDRIFPNHGNPDVISHGGYKKTLIDATMSYLRKLVARAHDPDYLKGTLEEYVGDSVQRGWVSIWWAYHDAHRQNLEKVATAWKDKALPNLPPP
jgi:cyclase